MHTCFPILRALLETSMNTLAHSSLGSRIRPGATASPFVAKRMRFTCSIPRRLDEISSSAQCFYVALHTDSQSPRCFQVRDSMNPHQIRQCRKEPVSFRYIRTQPPSACGLAFGDFCRQILYHHQWHMIGYRTDSIRGISKLLCIMSI